MKEGNTNLILINMEQKKIKKEEVSLIFYGAQLIYILMAAGFYIHLLFAAEVIHTAPFFLQNGFVWTLSLAFISVDHVIISGSDEERFGSFQSAIRGCLFALMIFHGNTVGMTLSLIFLFFAYSFHPIGSWKKTRPDVGLFSCVTVLAVLGLFLMILDRGSWWLQTKVIGTWIIDATLLVTILLLGRKKLWEKIDSVRALKLIMRVMAIILSVLFVLATVTAFFTKNQEGLFAVQPFMGFRYISIMAFYNIGLLKDFSLNKEGISTGAQIILLLLFITFIVLTGRKNKKKREVNIPEIIFCAVLFAALVIPTGIIAVQNTSDKNLQERLVKDEQTDYSDPELIVVSEDEILGSDEMDIRCSVDGYDIRPEGGRIDGWLLLTDENSSNIKTTVCIRNSSTGEIYRLVTKRNKRKDVAGFFENKDYLLSGFIASFPDYVIPGGEYDLIFEINISDDEEVVYFDPKIELDIMTYTEYVREQL